MAENTNTNTTQEYDRRIVRVRRVIEYVGEATWVAGTLGRSFALPRPFRSGAGGIVEISRELIDAPDDLPRDSLTRNTRPPLVYIAGKFAGATPEEHQANVDLAAAYRCLVARAGCYPVCPHTNTRDMGGTTGTSADPKEQEFWYDASCELLRRCDAVLMIPGWQDSRGAKRELSAAKSWGIPVLHAIGVDDDRDLKAWLERGA